MAACRDRRFKRISKGFDLKRHTTTRLVVIGTGGSASLISNCARMGFEDFVLIDPDILVDANVASQQASTDHIGMPKVQALAEQIVKINPRASVKPLVCRVDDIDDHDFADLLFSTRDRYGPASEGPSRQESSNLAGNYFRPMPRTTCQLKRVIPKSFAGSEGPSRRFNGGCIRSINRRKSQWAGRACHRSRRIKERRWADYVNPNRNANR
jgi:hypothetical protein